MNLNDLLKIMTLEQKLAQISQYNANCLDISVSGEITGPAQKLDLKKEDIFAVGSVLNFGTPDEVIEMQKLHLENDPNKIPMLFMLDIVHGYKTIYPIPLGSTINKYVRK